MRLPAAALHAHEQLVQELDVGLHPAGSRLPGERELSARFHVSRATLRIALSALEAEGRLQRSAQRLPAQRYGLHSFKVSPVPLMRKRPSAEHTASAAGPQRCQRA